MTAASPSVQAQTILAAFGDWGDSGSRPDDVANMVKSAGWGADYVLTLGDNHYGQIDVGHSDWESRLGSRYGGFMKGRADNRYSNQTSATQRFFPTVGNHDSSATGTGQSGSSGGIIPGYVDYFHTDPGNPGRLPAGVHNSTHSYYDVVLPIEGGSGTIRLFAMDSDSFRVNASSRNAQRAWLEDGLRNSTSTWNIVTTHHPAYSSGSHGSDATMQLPFQQWGADVVLSGHDHDYERLRITDSTQTDMLYLVVGLGGRSPRGFDPAAPGSEVRFTGQVGAQRITVTDTTATFEFLSVGGPGGAGVLRDSFTLTKPVPEPASLILWVMGGVGLIARRKRQHA